MARWWKIVSLAAVIVAGLGASAARAQPPVARPQPPPPAPTAKAPAKPGTATAPAPAGPQQSGTKAQPAPATAAPAAVPAPRDQTPAAPVETETPPAASQLNAPVLSGSQYLGSYDAGMGQTFYLYGSTQTFADVVTYYRNVLKDRGELVFDAPATHVFEVGKFKETEVAFPPGVTIKDYTSDGSPGYMNPRPGAAPAYFPTVIQILPPPPALAGRRN